MKIFYLDKSCLFLLIVIILCGLFNNFTVYFLLLIIHELGHMIAGRILGCKLEKIKIYAYGGNTVFKSNYNFPLFKELIVLIMGPIMQIIGYFVLKQFINYDYLGVYHYSLLIFNLLPIYPLDGGKLLNIILNYCFNYKWSFYISFYSSLVVIIGLIIYNIYNFNLNLLLIIMILITKLIEMYRFLNYTYNQFLLERYLHNYSFKKIKCIDSSTSFSRDCHHIIKIVPEKKFLINYFNK